MPAIRRSQVPELLAGQSTPIPQDKLEYMHNAFNAPHTRDPGLFETLYNNAVDPTYLYDAQGLDMNKAASAPTAPPELQQQLQEQLMPGFGQEQNINVPQGTFVRRNSNGDLELAYDFNRKALAPSESPLYNSAVAIGHALGLGTGAEAAAPAGVGAAAGAAAFADRDPSMMRTFFGPNSKGAPLHSLPNAVTDLTAGKSPTDIWRKYGWSPSASNDLVWELSDHGAGFTPTVQDALKANNAVKLEGPLNQVLNHPELFNLIDFGLANAPVEILQTPFSPRSGMFSANWDFKNNPAVGSRLPSGSTPSIQIQGNNPADLFSTLMHEVQHGVQNQDGRIFLAGGPSYLEDDIVHALFNDPALLTNIPGSRRFYDPKSSPHWDTQGLAYDVYKRQAHEVEARNVQTRLNLPPTTAKNAPPWTTMDVPYNDQLIGFNSFKKAQ